MDASLKKGKGEKNFGGNVMHQVNGLFDKFLSPQQTSVLPVQATQKPSSSLLQSRWFRLSVVFYIVFCILMASAHFSAWILFKGKQGFTSIDRLELERTYDAGNLR